MPMGKTVRNFTGWEKRAIVLAIDREAGAKYRQWEMEQKGWSPE